MGYIPITVQGFSVREGLFKDLEKTLDGVKAAGFDGIEFFGPFQWEAARIDRALKNSGLICSGWHVATDTLYPENLDATVEYNLTFGSKQLVMPRISDEMFATYAAISGPTADFFAATNEKLKAYGVRTGIHNHHREFKKLPDADMTILEAVTKTTPADFIIQFDTGNAMAAGADPVEEIKKLVGRVESLHVKPYSKTTGASAVIGADDIDLDFILPFSRENCGTKALVIEFEGEGDAMDFSARCYRGLIENYSPYLEEVFVPGNR